MADERNGDLSCRRFHCGKWWIKCLHINSKQEFICKGFIKCLHINSKPELTCKGFIKCLRIKSELEFTRQGFMKCLRINSCPEFTCKGFINTWKDTNLNTFTLITRYILSLPIFTTGNSYYIPIQRRINFCLRYLALPGKVELIFEHGSFSEIIITFFSRP